MSQKVRITLVKSPIGRNPIHRKTLRALGLRKMWAEREHTRTPVVDGMIRQVDYLLRIEDA